MINLVVVCCCFVFDMFMLLSLLLQLFNDVAAIDS